MEDPTIREVHLERYKVAAVQYLTPDLLKHFGETCQVDVFWDELALRIVQTVWGREAERQEHKWPANWWEAFKDRWFPKWAKERWPIRHSTCVLTARELYPKAAMPEREHSIVILKSIDGQALSRIKCPHCGHKNLAQAGVCAHCDEYLD